MALPNDISFNDKQDRVTSPYADENKVMASDINELKNFCNDLKAELVSKVRQTIVVFITVPDFNGTYYQNTDLVGLTPGTDFQLYTNNGSGVLMEYTGSADDGFDFDDATARNYTAQDNYLLIIHKPLS